MEGTDDHIISFICNITGIPRKQVIPTVKLVNEGATIPFISRYRKEATMGLDEVAIQKIIEANEKAIEIEKRKAFIIESIKAQGKLTPELEQKLIQCNDSTLLEDLYLPYKSKRRTRAEIARRKGLEPLAKIIMAQNSSTDISKAATRFTSDEVSNIDDAIAGASDIIAEWIAENSGVRNSIRNIFSRQAIIHGSVIKGKEEEASNYRNYFNFSTSLNRCNSYKLLALRRAEKDGFLRVSIDVDENAAIDRISSRVIRQSAGQDTRKIIKEAISDSYKRLLKPSIENEFSTISKEKADDEAINMFAENARQLLFAPPLGKKRVLAIDPGYRTGCKIVCLDEQGNLLYNDTIYPTPPKNERETAARKISRLVETYHIDAIALGNGTASRETESFLASIRYPRPINVFVVSEDGASIYSASKLAREEFPDKDVTVRGAVSIGRRLLDPLAELVKIDPKSIGVGQYQHDVDQAKLKHSLEFTVESCVNNVGVNLNTASKELLTYISGLGPQLAQNIVDYRKMNGDFKNRSELRKVPKLGPKTFEQCAGFLRIPNGNNPLDNTAVHPERYPIVEKMAADLGCNISELIGDKQLRSRVDINKYVSESLGLPTLTDIIAELDKPGRDPRHKISSIKFDDSVTKFEDLKPGMELNGIVTNITQFGVFVDIGIKENGLVHISELSDHFVSSPLDIVRIHQHIKVRIEEIDADRRRISLTMKGFNK